MSDREIHDKLDPKVWIDGAPIIRPSEDGHDAELVFRWSVKTRYGVIEITKIPFYTDYASIPDSVSFIFARILPKHGCQDFAAIVHDWIYYSGCKSKPVADRIFYELMLNLGVSKVKAWIMYKAVVWFGGSTWDDYRSRELKVTREAIDSAKERIMQ